VALGRVNFMDDQLISLTEEERSKLRRLRVLATLKLGGLLLVTGLIVWAWMTFILSVR